MVNWPCRLEKYIKMGLMETELVFTCLQLTIETLEQGTEYIQS